MALRKFLFANTTEGYSETFTSGGVDSLDMGASKIENLLDPTAPQDAATKYYVDSVASGLDWKQSSRLATAAALPAYTAAGSGVGKTLTGNANGALTVDGVAVVNGNRVIVKNEGVSHVDHGIYTQTQLGTGGTPFILTRATDFDTNAEVTAGAASFVEEGTVNADTGWVLTTNDPIVVDTTALAFAQFSSTVSYTFDQGLSLTGSSVKVELDTAADAQGAGAGGGSSGLEFDVNTAAGKLRAAVSTTRAINRFGDGLGIELDPTANTAGANPTNATSAAGLTNLRSPKTEDNYTANEAFAVGDPVAWAAAVNDKLAKGRADSDAKSRIVGVARTASTALNDTAAIVSEGIVPSALAGATAGDPYYLGNTGGLVLFAAILAGRRVIRIGYAKNATDLFVDVADLGKKAA